jgi:UDP-N-acetylglucosamine--N-acetylmuramyl-(pentapeptide) pyrophosphoryl-undecaprenol N-acetylglucosamine transferase
MPRAPRLLLAAGGTGGHLFPGVAVAEGAQRTADAAVLFVGTSGGMEKDVIPQLGFSLRFIPAEQLRGRTWWGKIRALGVAGYGVGSAWRIIREFAPDVIFSIGGYASAPTVLAGWLQRIPCVLLEPNAIPGLTNRFLSRFAARVCLGFETASRFFPPHKVVHTGNPVRHALQPTLQPAPTDKPLTILVFGGSAGAHRLNHIVPQALALLHKRRSGRKSSSPAQTIQIIHQTGQAEYAAVTASYAAVGIMARVVPFIDAMQEVYAEADLVICRAGAMTTAELTLLGKPAILIPYPYAADDHQRANAEALVQAGAAVMLLDHTLSPELLERTIARLVQQSGTLGAMARAAAALGRPDATAAVVQTCFACTSDGSSSGQEVPCQER